MSTREERLELRLKGQVHYERPQARGIASAVAHIARAASMANRATGGDPATGVVKKRKSSRRRPNNLGGSLADSDGAADEGGDNSEAVAAASGNHVGPLSPRDELIRLQERRERARELERLERQLEQDRLDREELVPDSKKAPQVGRDD